MAIGMRVRAQGILRGRSLLSTQDKTQPQAPKERIRDVQRLWNQTLQFLRWVHVPRGLKACSLASAEQALASEHTIDDDPSGTVASSALAFKRILNLNLEAPQSTYVSSMGSKSLDLSRGVFAGVKLLQRVPGAHLTVTFMAC